MKKYFEEVVPQMNLSIEKNFPHIFKNLSIFWGSSIFNDYVDTLVSVERKERQGFPFEVLMELQKIVDKHEEEYPQFKRQRSIWV